MQTIRNLRMSIATFCDVGGWAAWLKPKHLAFPRHRLGLGALHGLSKPDSVQPARSHMQKAFLLWVAAASQPPVFKDSVVEKGKGVQRLWLMFHLWHHERIQRYPWRTGWQDQYSTVGVPAGKLENMIISPLINFRCYWEAPQGQNGTIERACKLSMRGNCTGQLWFLQNRLCTENINLSAKK